MPGEEILSDWLTAKQAAEIISRNSGKTIPPAYINQLVRQKRLNAQKIDARTNLYSRSEVEKIVVVSRRGGRGEKDTIEKPSGFSSID